MSENIKKGVTISGSAAVTAIGRRQLERVNELDEVFSDTQVRDRGLTVSVSHPLSAALTLISNPLRFSDTPLGRYEPPPMLGQHTESVLRDLLGVSEAELLALKKAKAI